MDENMYSNCQCGFDRSFTIENIGEYVLFDLSIIDENALNFHIEETLTITGNYQMEIIGAIKHKTQHFIPIVKIKNKWCVLDDMQDEPIIATTSNTCLNLIDYNNTGKMMGICWLLYRKIADKSVEMETEIPSLTDNLNVTIIKATASQKAKQRKRKRDKDFSETQKRINIEDTCFVSNNSEIKSVL
jgi:hypothetical protein